MGCGLGHDVAAVGHRKRHFFGGDMELDIDPREVVSETADRLAVDEGGTQAFAFLQVRSARLSQPRLSRAADADELCRSAPEIARRLPQRSN